MTDNKISGYERIYLDLAALLPAFDLTGNAPHLGLEPKGEGVLVRFLGRDYQVDGQGVRALDGAPAGVNQLSLIAHYAMSPGRGEAASDYLPLRRMTGMVEGRGTYDRDAISRPLERVFEGDLEALGRAAAGLDGVAMGRDESGALVWEFRAFPKVCLRLAVQEADEEFPAEYRLLFSSNATDFMEFEALGFLAGVFTTLLTRTGD